MKKLLLILITPFIFSSCYVHKVSSGNGPIQGYTKKDKQQDKDDNDRGHCKEVRQEDSKRPYDRRNGQQKMANRCRVLEGQW